MGWNAYKYKQVIKYKPKYETEVSIVPAIQTNRSFEILRGQNLFV